MFQSLWRTFERKDTIGAVWCSLVHDSPMWPIHGRYECAVCGRHYQVPWAEAPSEGAVPARRVPSAVLSALLLVAVVAWPGFGAEPMTVDSPDAAAVLQRFMAGPGQSGSWSLETIEIEASLPRLKKTGRLRAIRRLFPVGRPDYRVLEISGDSTVKNQVIVRYIAADEKAIELPASSVALSPENYKIHYSGTVRLGNRVAYAFRVIPRQKREGLINGVLWLDSETAIAVRESGYLAKSPSVFLKRINLTRENEVRDGTVASRVTHVSIETRLIGRAQLVIVEHPPSDEAAASVGAGEGQ